MRSITVSFAMFAPEASMRPWRSHGNELLVDHADEPGVRRFNAAVAEPRK